MNSILALKMTEDRCLFEETFGCQSKKDQISKAGPTRIATIINFSKEYQDGIHIDLSERLNLDPNLVIHCHRSCVSTYTSKHHLQRHKKRSADESPCMPSRKKRRSDASPFRFKEHCIFCGEICNLQKDKKHPDRWQKAALCQTAYAAAGRQSFKESILHVCSERNDAMAGEVRTRVEGALSDLHAADARYHVNCMTCFMAPRSVAAAKNTVNQNEENRSGDDAFNHVTDEMKADKSRIWNTKELVTLYDLSGGTELNQRSLLKRVKDYFSDEVVVLTSPGLCSLVVFRASASNVLSLAAQTEDEQDSAKLVTLAKDISNEIKQIEYDGSRYDIRITKQDMSVSVSQTLMELLALLSNKLDYTLPALLIGNIITSVITNKPTNLQIALGNLLRDSRKLINPFYQFGVTCSYDEILRFKKSAALAATKEIKLSGIEQASDGLIQAVADNFDADISSQNGKLATHSLAMLITQPARDAPDNEENGEGCSIRRISKSEMSAPIDFEIPVQRYQGPKIVPMPPTCASKSVLPLKVLCSAAIAERRAKEIDFSFLRDVTNEESCPEFNGYNTTLTRQQGISYAPKTQAAYLPLIDMTPSDPDTILTALHEAKRLTEERGQKKTIFTSDQQLYKVAVEVKWTDPERFADVIVRLGGMHMLMSFVGAIGTLMQGSGLVDVLSSTFSGVSKMLSGKKFPQNARALRIVCEELLRRVLERSDIHTMDELIKHLDYLADKSKTAKLWIDCLIKPVFIMMLYVRAEREGDWPLHLAAVRKMLPYFFSSSHVNYARYGLYYLRSMESLDSEVLSHFMKGQHVMHHIPGIWNGIWSDMYIETTFMRYGHAPGGIIGITLKPEALKTWALGLHICSRLEEDISDIVNGDAQSTQDTHKEETQARIASDGKDRQSIRKKLDLCVDPLDTGSHPVNIVNIVTGQIADSSVNVQDALAIGKKSMKEFEGGWPEGFSGPISKKVKTIADCHKFIKVGSKKVFDTTVIYSRVIGVQASSREIDIEKVISHELAPVPTSMFHDDGSMRICKGKSDLKKRLAIETSPRQCNSVNAVVLDGSAILWIVHWPAKGAVVDYIENFKKFLVKKLEDSDVYLIFDRYPDYSTKSVTRDARECTASRVFQLSEQAPLPPQNVILTVSKNKVQLMSMICSNITKDKTFQSQHSARHKLVITGSKKKNTTLSFCSETLFIKQSLFFHF